MSDRKGKAPRWRRALKIMGKVFTVIGAVLIPLDMWSRAEFAADKRWLWDRILARSHDWASSIIDFLGLKNLVLPIILLAIGLAVLLSLRVLDARDSKRQRTLIHLKKACLTL